MAALEKLDKLKLQLDLLENNSRRSIGDNKISSEDIQIIKDIRKSLAEVSNDLKQEIKYKDGFHESYRSAESEQKAMHTDEHMHDDETLQWLDVNYGGDDGSILESPTRSPLIRFKMMGNLIKSEVKECRKYGFDTQDIKGSGWARMSVSVNTAVSLSNIVLAVPRIEKLLGNCWNFDEFDIFELAAMSEIRGHVLLVFASYLSKQFRFMSSYHIPKDKFHNFLLAIEQSYNDVPYHNKIHAADVTHTMMHFCMTSTFKTNMTALDNLCCFIAAICHDVAHTGQTNNYHINSTSTLAIRYNDRSVLENFHLATTFQLLTDQKNNFLENLTKTEYKYVRETVIEMVLATDLFYHQKQLKQLHQFTNIIKAQNKLELQVYTDNKMARIANVRNEKRFIMTIALHLSDISNPAKKLSVSIEWTQRITQEFFLQGDMERVLNLPISPACDRNTNQNMAKQTLAFIDFIVYPIFAAYHIIDGETKKFITALKRTREYWSKM